MNLEQCFKLAIKQIIFNTMKSNIKQKPKRKTSADMTPEQIERAREHRLNWYRKNKEKVRIQAKDKYNSDYNYWKRVLDYQRERYRTSHANIEKRKPGRKPRPSSDSDDEKSRSPPRCRGRPRLRTIDENKAKRKPGRPISSKQFTIPA